MIIINTVHTKTKTIKRKKKRQQKSIHLFLGCNARKNDHFVLRNALSDPACIMQHRFIITNEL